MLEGMFLWVEKVCVSIVFYAIFTAGMKCCIGDFNFFLISCSPYILTKTNIWMPKYLQDNSSAKYCYNAITGTPTTMFYFLQEHFFLHTWQHIHFAQPHPSPQARLQLEEVEFGSFIPGNKRCFSTDCLTHSPFSELANSFLMLSSRCFLLFLTANIMEVHLEIPSLPALPTSCQ